MIDDLMLRIAAHCAINRVSVGGQHLCVGRHYALNEPFGGRASKASGHYAGHCLAAALRCADNRRVTVSGCALAMPPSMAIFGLPADISFVNLDLAGHGRRVEGPSARRMT